MHMVRGQYKMDPALVNGDRDGFDLVPCEETESLTLLNLKNLALKVRIVEDHIRR